MTLLLNCLYPERDDQNRELEHLLWIHNQVMIQFRTSTAHQNTDDHRHLLLFCIVDFVTRQLLKGGDGFRVLLSSSILIDIMCRFDVPVGGIKSVLARDISKCSILEAAGILRLKMFLRYHPQPEDSIDGESSDDVEM
ncbi:Hypothetical predicted protein [Lecanosticta acicola]|uniref:Uncharacterized protein n=1 Tax=Lecanosticta acicola TaxID=111012 RepID=A0AAI8YU03_9PEZI|nr:Hypothetical predicted protein [Lecanosticta acicola]